MKRFWLDFKAFALKGNIIDLAVGVIIGSAFSKIVTSLVSDLIMPLIGLLTGGVNIAGLFYALDGGIYPSLEAAKAAGVGTLNYGTLLQNIINFLIVALSIFVTLRTMTLLGKRLSLIKDAPEPAVGKCPYCLQKVDPKATRCMYCTSDLPAIGEGPEEGQP